MYRFLYPMSCFPYGVLTSSVLPSSLSDNKSLYRFPANLSCGFSQAHRGICNTSFCVAYCILLQNIPLSPRKSLKFAHLGSSRYHLSSEGKNRNLTRLDALISIWVFSALSLLLFRLQNLPPYGIFVAVGVLYASDTNICSHGFANRTHNSMILRVSNHS